jgi:rod shape-determining protein MreC
MPQLSSRALFATALLILAAALFLLSLGGYLGPAEDFLLRPFSATQEWVARRVFAVRNLLSSPGDVTALQQRVAELEAERARLEEEIIALREQAAEAEVLSALLGYARQRPERGYLAAAVIGRDPSAFLQSVSIGVGSDQGIRYGMPVVTDRGLVGRIVEVNATSARVQLLTDPEFSVNVKLLGSPAEGVLSAQPNGELWIELIDQDAAVEPGALVLTSGLGGGFPADIPVGQVTSVRRRDFELFQRATLQPAVALDDVEIVLVITNFFPQPESRPAGAP